MVGFSRDSPPAVAATAAVDVATEGDFKLSLEALPLVVFFVSKSSALEGVVTAVVKNGVFDSVGVATGAADVAAIAASTYGGRFFCTVAVPPAGAADAVKAASVVTLSGR